MAGLSFRDPDSGVLLSAYLDGELAGGELDLVVDHLNTSVTGIAEFRLLQEARTAVRTLPLLEMPERLLPIEHYGDKLSAYLDGELPTKEVQVVAAHLVGCRQCREDLHELDAARIAIRSLPGIEPPEFLSARRRKQASRRMARHGRLAAWAAGAAAALVLLAGMISNATTSSPNPTFDLDVLRDRHVARASVQPGFSVFPAASEGANP